MQVYVVSQGWDAFENKEWYWSHRSPIREGVAWISREEWELIDAKIRKRCGLPEPCYAVFEYYAQMRDK